MDEQEMDEQGTGENAGSYDLKALFPQAAPVNASLETQIVGITAAFCAYKQLKGCPAGALPLEIILQSAEMMAKMFLPLGSTDTRRREDVHSALHAIMDLIMQNDDGRILLTHSFTQRMRAMDTDNLPNGLICPFDTRSEEYPL